MHVVVTGGTGFIGKAVCEWLTRNAVSHEPWGQRTCDLRKPAEVRSQMRTSRATHVIHLAATGVSPGTSPSDDICADNLEMAASLVNVLAGTSVRLVAAGSVAEYGPGGAEYSQIPETAVCTPNTPYGSGKLAATQLFLANSHQIDVRVARLFGVFGPGEGPKRLFPAVASALWQGKEIALSDGLQIRDFVHVIDAAEVLGRLLLTDSAPTLMNVGTGIGTSVQEAVLKLASALGANPGLLRFGCRPRNPTDASRLVADCSRLTEYLGKRLPSRLEPDDLRTAVKEFQL